MLDAVSESKTWEVARIRAAVSAVLEGIRKSFFYQTGPSPKEAGGPADGCSHCTCGLRASAEDMRSGLVKSHGNQLQLGRAESRAWLQPSVASSPSWSLPACPAWDCGGEREAGRDSRRRRNGKC